MTAIALIPARGGSKRVERKNVRPLNGIPLIAYTIRAVIDSGCFSKVLVSSDDTETLETAAHYGADCLRRPDALATDTSPDIEWVEHALNTQRKITPAGSYPVDAIVDGAIEEERNNYIPYDTFSILRPTSPFRLPSTIQRAFREWGDAHASGEHYTSLRAVEKVSQHPAKMWYLRGKELVPVHPQPAAQPFHDSQMASLPDVWVQNASLEIAWVSTVTNTGTISGQRVLPFLTCGFEGFDVNTERDFMVAEQMVLDGVELPDVT